MEWWMWEIVLLGLLAIVAGILYFNSPVIKDDEHEDYWRK